MTNEMLDKLVSCDLEIFKLFLSDITREKINECFIEKDQEYTLLTFFCYKASTCRDLRCPLIFFEEKLRLIIEHGGDPKRVVGIGKKTGLSYLVKQRDIYPVKVYIKLGGVYSLGHLLVNCILLDKDIDTCYSMFTYLCSLKLNPNEIDPCTGMNTFAAICSLDNRKCRPEIALDILINYYIGLFELDIDLDLDVTENSNKLDSRLEIYTSTKNNEFDELIDQVHNNSIENRFSDICLLDNKEVVGQFIGKHFIKL